jgi:hypothetical protein
VCHKNVKSKTVLRKQKRSGITKEQEKTDPEEGLLSSSGKVKKLSTPTK